jgi:hypothetical protein
MADDMLSVDAQVATGAIPKASFKFPARRKFIPPSGENFPATRAQKF